MLQELQDVHSAMEEAKADIVGLWALRFLVNKVLSTVLFRFSLFFFVCGNKNRRGPLWSFDVVTMLSISFQLFGTWVHTILNS